MKGVDHEGEARLESLGHDFRIDPSAIAAVLHLYAMSKGLSSKEQGTNAGV